MNEYQIHCFLTAADCLNFTKAAQLLNMTQPAVTHQISAMEQELGMPLFIRDKRTGTQLTPAGQVMVERLRRMHEWVRDAVSAARAAQDGCEGVLTLCFLDGHWIDERTRRIVHAFHVENPNVHLVVKKRVNAQQIAGLLGGTYDLVMGMDFDFTELPGVETQEVLRVPHYLLLPPNHPAEAGAVYDLSDFASETMIAPNEGANDALDRAYRNMCQREGFEMRHVSVLDHRDQVAMLELGMGITCGDPYSCYFHAGPFKAVRLRGAPEVVTVMAWRKENHNTCLARFRAFYAAACEREKEEPHETDPSV